MNLDLTTIDLPIHAQVSFLHRVSGVFLIFGMVVLFWLLGESLSGPAGFDRARECLQSFWGKLAVWGVLVGLIYHTAAGVRHLIMDCGVGESLEAGITSSRIVIGVSIALIVLAGLWVW